MGSITRVLSASDLMVGASRSLLNTASALSTEKARKTTTIVKTHNSVFNTRDEGICYVLYYHEVYLGMISVDNYDIDSNQYKYRYPVLCLEMLFSVFDHYQEERWYYVKSQE